VADGEHRTMNAVQAAGGDPIANGARAQAELDELPERDNPVLPSASAAIERSTGSCALRPSSGRLSHNPSMDRDAHAPSVTAQRVIATSAPGSVTTLRGHG